MKRTAHMQRKWLAFRVLEGKSKALRWQSRLQQQVRHRPAAHGALIGVGTMVITLCALNDDPLMTSVHLRGITQAGFCVVAAGMYCVFMIMSRVVSIVLSCAEERHMSLSQKERERAAAALLSFDDDEDDLDDRCCGHSGAEEGRGGDDNDRIALDIDRFDAFCNEREDKEEADDNTTTISHDGKAEKAPETKLLTTAQPSTRRNSDASGIAAGVERRRALRKRKQNKGVAVLPVGMPREVIISSMYLGGTGTFLAVGALCMWDCAVTLAFLVSLYFIALWDTPRHLYRSRAYWCLIVAVAFTLSFGMAIEVSSRLDSSVALAKLENEHASNGTLREDRAAVPNSDTEAILLLMQARDPPLWPFLLLSAFSPILLRAAGGGVFVGGLYHSMTPSQTLETGLPVNSLLAGLALSWFSPIEAALSHSKTLLRPNYFLTMMLLAPPTIAATLALLLHALRRRTALISTAFLLFLLMVRQQLVHSDDYYARALYHYHHMYDNLRYYYNYNNEARTTPTPPPTIIAHQLNGTNTLDVMGMTMATLSLIAAAWLATCSQGMGAMMATGDDEGEGRSNALEKAVDDYGDDVDDEEAHLTQH